jgi:cell division protein FtsW
VQEALKVRDPWLVVWAGVATVLGLFFIFDAGFARSVQTGNGPIPREFVMQCVFCVAGAVAWMIGSATGPDRIQKFAKIAWVASFLGLIAVKVLGHEQNGAQRWVDIGPVSIQPSEFVKLTVVLYLAAVFADRAPWKVPKLRNPNLAKWLDHVAIPKFVRCLPAAYVLVAVFMIEKEPDLGTAAIIGATAFGMFVLGGASRWTLALGIGISVFGAWFLVNQESYRLERIQSHFSRWDPSIVDDATYQTAQAELAMADGGLFGVGIGAGRLKHLIAAPTTDFILATIAEETGLVGALVVLGVLFGLAWRLFTLAGRASSRFASLVLSGAGVWIAVQTCTNALMANAFLPTIGIPLPFVSSGGSSLIALWLTLGVCNAMLVPGRQQAVEPQEERNDANHRDRRRDGRAYLPRTGGSDVGARSGARGDVLRVRSRTGTRVG